MIMSIAKDYIKPHKAEEYFVLIEKLIRSTREEPGNIEYKLFKENASEGQFVILEYWKNEEALETHFKSDHFIRIVPQIQKLQEKPTEVSVYHEVKWD